MAGLSSPRTSFEKQDAFEPMAEIQDLSEYKVLVDNLPYIKPFKGCCSSPLVVTVYVEPLAERNPLEFERTCVVQCPECKKLYVSNWQ